LHSRSRQSCPPESPRLTYRWRSRVFRCLTGDRHSFSWMGTERPDEKWEKQENLWDAAQRLAQGNLPAYPSGASPADATSLRLVRDPRLNGTVTAVVRGTAVGACACPSRSVSTISMPTSVETCSRESQMRFFGLPTYAFVRPAYCCANHAWPSGSGLWARNRSHLCIAWQKFDAAFGPIAVTVGGGKD